MEKPQPQEQSAFSLVKGNGGEPVRHPIAIPRIALHALGKDDVVVRCMKFREIRPERLQAEWFVAAGVHLRRTAETDLVVMPRMLLDHPEHERSESGCWDGVNDDPFWILRKTDLGYDVVLSESTDAMEILPVKTHGFRDVVLYSSSKDSFSSRPMKFDGNRYADDRTSR
jgi:hypothetical protein